MSTPHDDDHHHLIESPPERPPVPGTVPFAPHGKEYWPSTGEVTKAAAARSQEDRWIFEEEKKKSERLHRELEDERRKRENERSEFMALLRQREETTQLITHETNRANRRWWHWRQRSKVRPSHST